MRMLARALYRRGHTSSDARRPRSSKMILSTCSATTTAAAAYAASNTTTTTGACSSASSDSTPPCASIEVPSTDELNAEGGCVSCWAQSRPEAASQVSLRAGCYRITIADADVVRCVQRTETEDGALQRAYDTHAVVYWPSTAIPSTAAASSSGKWAWAPGSGSTHEYGVVFVPGTGAGVGPAYRHRPARNKYPGPIDVGTFHPDHEAFFPTTARALVTEGVPTIQVTWSDFRAPPASAAERAYGYDGGSKTNPAVPLCPAAAGAGEEEVEMVVDAMGDVASAKVEAAIKLLLLNGCRSVVLAGHSMGAAICCETARRQLAADTRATGRLSDTEHSQNGPMLERDAVSWRQPTQLRALCMLSGAAIHWTLGSWRTLAHRVLANEAEQSLLEQHEVPLLIVNAEHDIGCAKGVYWEEGDGRDGAAVERQGMFARTAKDYFVVEDHTHSWFRGTESSKPSNVADEHTWDNADRLASDTDGRGIYEVQPTIDALGSLLREWLARHDQAAWRAKHGQGVENAGEKDQTAVGTWISVGSGEKSTPKHCDLLASL